ncbi:MAG: GlsB/YeaQ/YmgE family stress response membrane protein [Actinomycetota bacterium]
MGLLSWLLTGLIVGAIARFLIPGPHHLGCIGTSVLGILGSIVGGTIFNALAGDGFELQTSGFLGAVFGAAVLLVLGRVLGGGQRSSPPARR